MRRSEEWLIDTLVRAVVLVPVEELEGGVAGEHADEAGTDASCDVAGGLLSSSSTHELDICGVLAVDTISKASEGVRDDVGAVLENLDDLHLELLLDGLGHAVEGFGSVALDLLKLLK